MKRLIRIVTECIHGFYSAYVKLLYKPLKEALIGFLSGLYRICIRRFIGLTYTRLVWGLYTAFRMFIYGCYTAQRGNQDEDVLSGFSLIVANTTELNPIHGHKSSMPSKYQNIPTYVHLLYTSICPYTRS